MSNQQPAPRDRGGLRLGRVRGVVVLVAPSWLVVGLLLAVIYGPVIEDAVPGISGSAAYAAAIGFSLLFGLCVLAHEIGHTLVSLALGHPVRRVVLFALGGVSEIDGEPERPRDELLIAACGPLVSVALGGLAYAGYRFAPADSLLAALLALLAWSNLVLAAFNLLPGLPLDGGRLLRAVVCSFGARPLTGTRVAAWSGRVLAVAIFLSGLLVERTSLGIAAGVFSAALAGYLWAGASRSLKVAALLSEVPNLSVSALLRPGMYIRDDISVSEALDRAWQSHARGLVLLDSGDRPSALVDELLIGSVPPDRRPWTPVADVARRLEPGLTVREDIDGAGLLRHIQTTPAREYLVVRADGSAAGILATRDLALRLQRGAGLARPRHGPAW